MAITLAFKIWTGDFYAIRQKSTGYMIPEGEGRRGRGTTHQEPNPCIVCPPKLYHTEAAAKCSLTWWLKGKTSVSMCGSYEYGDLDEQWETQDMGRDPKDFHVVPIHMTNRP